MYVTMPIVHVSYSESNFNIQKPPPKNKKKSIIEEVIPIGFCSEILINCLISSMRDTLK